MQKQLQRVQISEKNAVYRLIKTGYSSQHNVKQCLDTINTLISELEQSGDRSGPTVLTITHLNSVKSIINSLSEYSATPSENRRHELISIAKAYGNDISELIHSVVD